MDTAIDKPKVERGPAFHRRMPVKTLKILTDIFKDNPHRLGAREISKRASIPLNAARDLMLLSDRRLDLLGDVLGDRIALYKAIAAMRAEPEKWEHRLIERTRL